MNLLQRRGHTSLPYKHQDVTLIEDLLAPKFYVSLSVNGCSCHPKTLGHRDTTWAAFTSHTRSAASPSWLAGKENLQLSYPKQILVTANYVEKFSSAIKTQILIFLKKLFSVKKKKKSVSLYSQYFQLTETGGILSLRFSWKMLTKHIHYPFGKDAIHVTLLWCHCSTCQIKKQGKDSQK